jgi:uncharacterized protein (TIGR00297 family)
MLLQLIIGLLASTAIGIIAYRKAALSKSGVAGAILTGTAIFGFGGWTWGMVLITFFVLSSILSKVKTQSKQALAEKFDKGSQRDFWQAFANAGAGSIIALLYALVPSPALLFAFTGAMATVNADTWATEIGVLSKTAPRLITTGRRVEPGTSGGISRLGTAVTLSGGLVIGLATVMFLAMDTVWGGSAFTKVHSNTMLVIVAIPFSAALSGLCGSLCDSLLGATVQAIYYSNKRNKETEKVVDPDGSPNQLVRGWRWLNNDWVNFISSWVGAFVGLLLWLIIGG